MSKEVIYAVELSKNGRKMRKTVPARRASEAERKALADEPEHTLVYSVDTL